jgi:hypothetical protein
MINGSGKQAINNPALEVTICARLRRRKGALEERCP